MVPVTVQRALSLASRRHPAKTALRWATGSMTFAQIDQASTRLAHGLRAARLGRGARLGIMLPNGPEYVLLALACAKAVICMVPINYRFKAAEVVRQLEDCHADALVHGADFTTHAEAARAALGVDLISSGLREAPACTTRLEDLLAQGSDEALPMDATEDDLFYLGYTSGTTGRPKGAMVTQRNRALAYHYWALEFGINEDDVCLHCGPFHHTAPFTFTLVQLFMGGEVVILDAFNADAAVDALERHGVTWSFMVPYMLDRLLDLEPDRTSTRQRLRMLISGASALPTRTKERVLSRFPGLSLHEFYGATEAGVITNLRGSDQRRKTRCVGQPVADIEVEIRDETGSRLPAGVIGDIWLRGPTLFSGYFASPERTAEVTRGDWCTLGDVGRIDEEGYLYLVDRRKDVIKSGGVNVYPLEIEEVILLDAGVRECAVVGLPDERWGEAVHAFVVLVSSADGGALQRVERLCAAHLAGYKQPKAVHAISELPRNANGKVLKRDLRERQPALA